MTMDLPVSGITLDADLQPRQAIAEDVATEYAERIAGGVTLPPVVVFFDGATHWLADGYHRWHAHNALGLVEIAADVRQGSKRDALLFSLSANAEHGKPRGGSDLRKAYGIAVRHRLVPADDVPGVSGLLACSERWARELTREAREAKDRERDAAIVEARAQGGTLREVAEAHGVAFKTVARVSERKASEKTPPAAPPADDHVDPSWGEVLDALRTVATLPDPDDLFTSATRDVRASAGQHIDAAVTWMGRFARRLAGG